MLKRGQLDEKVLKTYRKLYHLYIWASMCDCMTQSMEKLLLFSFSIQNKLRSTVGYLKKKRNLKSILITIYKKLFPLFNSPLFFQKKILPF